MMRITMMFVATCVAVLCQAQIAVRSVAIDWKTFESAYHTTARVEMAHVSASHRVICHPISLAPSVQSGSELESLLRKFLSANRASLKIDEMDLAVRSITKAQRIWYAHFVQKHQGMEILDTEVTFRVHENGNMFMFGIDAFIIEESPISPGLDEDAVLDKLQRNRPQVSSLERAGSEYYLYPDRSQGKTTLRPVVAFHARSGNEAEIILADAMNGEVVEVMNKTYHGNITGTITGKILPRVVTDPQTSRSLPHLYVNVDGQQVVSDSLGAYLVNISGQSANLTAQLKGRYVDVLNFNNADAVISRIVDCDTEENLEWDFSNSSIAERNVYYHVNMMHDYNKAVDPGFDALDYPLQCTVNDNSAFCNAYWNGSGLFFNTPDVNCAMNAALGASVIYHEYGHATNDKLYQSLGAPFGLMNPTLHEAFADIYATLLLDDSRFALGWYGFGTMTRNLNNNYKYPGSLVGQQHTDGLILGGAFWDLGELVTPEKAYELSHFAKYGLPDDSAIGVAFAEVYLETLIADDDDGNLMNGTPNSAAIEEAFCKHGIGAELFVTRQLVHQTHPDVLADAGSYIIETSVPAVPAFMQSAEHLNLKYSVNNFEVTESVPMIQMSDTLFRASVPPQPEGTLLRYYFEIDPGVCGSELAYPSRDFMAEHYSFTVGSYLEVFHDNFEENRGWSLSTPGDNATGGRWNRAKPDEVFDGLGFLLIPGGGYPLDGDQCLVTGAARGTFWFSNDVDNGKTTTVSPVFSDLDASSVFSFYKWFVHGAEFVFPAQGRWKLEVTENGQNWVTIEDTQYGDHRYWIKSQFKFSDYINITDQVRIRVEVSDFGAGSIVEALVDEFTIKSLDVQAATGEIENTRLHIYPNPVRDVLHLDASGLSGEMDVSILNLHGMLIYAETYDARISSEVDLSGIAQGTYVVRVASEDNVVTKRIVKAD